MPSIPRATPIRRRWGVSDSPVPQEVAGDRGTGPRDAGAHLSALTDQERRVALAVGAGSSNKSAARQLTVSIKTIEFHLGNVYRKLGIATRAELAHLVGSRFATTDERVTEAGGNLPPEVSSLIGRGSDLTRLATLLGEHRLVTVTGVGGVGKTRLAVASARGCQSDFDDGAWFVELGSTASSDEVAAVCAAALGLRQRTSLTADDIAQALGGQHRIIVLDNCEHVLAAAVQVAVAIGRRCPNVSILATSRERLDVPHEVVLALTPVSLDDGPNEPSDASRLFAARAEAVLGSFAPNEREWRVVGEVVGHLDGLPLAIELAAARLVVFSLDDLRDRVDDRLRMLTRRGPSAGRQQSLLSTIEWSYDLLDDDEKRVFEALAVFVGDFDLTSAVAVAASSERHVGDSSHDGALEDRVTALVEKSMLVATHGPPGMRYRMLETVREFARSRLVARGDVDAARQRHLDRFLVFVTDANEGIRGPEELRWHRALLADWHNVRTAVATACAFDNGRSACRILDQTLWWIVNRLRGDADDLVQRVRQLPSIATLPERPIVTIAAAFMAYLRVDNAQAAALLEQARAEEAELGQLCEPWVHVITFFVVDREESYVETQRTVERARAAGSRFWEVVGAIQDAIRRYVILTVGHPSADEIAEHAAVIDHGRRLADELANPNGIAHGNFLYGGSLVRHDPDAAEPFLLRALEMATPLGLELLCGQVRNCLARVYAMQGRNAQALRITADSIQAHARAGATVELPNDVVPCAYFFDALGEPGYMPLAVGATRAIVGSDESFSTAALEANATQQLGVERYAELYERGRRIGVAEVAREMLAAIDRLSPDVFERATIET